MDALREVVNQQFAAIQSCELYVKPIKNLDGLTVGTRPLSLSEIAPILMGRLEKMERQGVVLQADRNEVLRVLVAGVFPLAPEIQPVTQLSAPALRRGH